jgi:carbon monoxide dehydrogenase subunit G
MKFSCETEINKPVEKVVELFDNPDNLKKWMEGLQSFEHISGTPGHPGAKSKLKFQMGKRAIEMIETVTVRNLPHEFSGTYEAQGVFSVVKNHFIPVDGNKTRYVTEQEFQFKGFMKVLGILMSGAFKKQSMKYLTDFKTFAEKS